MHTLKSIEITGFRGKSKKISLPIDRYANFLIGRNGTGKTTFINLIKAMLTANVDVLRSTEFRSADLRFKDEKSRKVARLTIKNVVEPDVLEAITYEYRDSSNAAPKTYEIYVRQARRIRLPNTKTTRTFFENDYEREMVGQRELARVLNKLIDVTWLSLHRKDTDSFYEEHEEWQEEQRYTSTVDEKLEQIFHGLSSYFFRLDAKIADRMRDFQKQSFLSFLTSDTRTDGALISEIDTNQEKIALARIFEQFDVDKAQFSKELDAQFSRFEEIRHSLSGGVRGLKRIAVVIDTLRLHYLVGRWESLQEAQKKIVEPKEHFEKVCSNLLFRKSLEIRDDNEIYIVDDFTKEPINSHELSSGEKQLLIFLGETLLQEKRPHIFLADEPELSLHIEWQETLVSNILDLNPNAQIIFATHSPDIVSSFQKNLIKMEELI